MEIILPHDSNLNNLCFKKNILISVTYDNNFLKYIDPDIIINYDDKLQLDEYITEKMNKHQLIGNVILEDLAKIIFNPKRLLKISDQYNIDMVDLVDIY